MTHDAAAGIAQAADTRVDAAPGRVTLGVMAAGFAVLVLWQLTAAVVGYRDRDGWSRHLMRAAAACRIVVY